jgi:SAM-dependent methyltransferase
MRWEFTVGSPPGRYALDNAAEQAALRFQVLERHYDPHTFAQLDRAGVGPGMRCLEVGAGGGSVAVWLADRVGPTGSVLATDLEPRLMADLDGRSNLDVVRHDILRDDLPGAAFDVVHARLVLLHLPERRYALERMIAALRPGGLLVVEEFDCAEVAVRRSPDPGAAALFTQVHDAFVRILAGAGADAAWALRAASAFREAGLEAVEEAASAGVWEGGGDGIALHRANTEQLQGDLREQGVGGDELRAFWDLLEDPGFAVDAYRLVTVAGRKPGAGARP